VAANDVAAAGGSAGPAAARTRAWADALSPWLADPVAWLIALATFEAYTVISVSRYLRLRPGSWDLGIYTEYVRQVAHLGAPVVPIRSAGFNLLGDHFQPIVMVLAPFFRVFPSPATLLLAQALLTGLSVIPVCRAARELAGTGLSRAVGIAYGFSWGLQQMINFDFHEIAFAVPLLAFSLSALVRGHPRAATWWAAPLVFVKEDQGFTMAAIGAIMLAAGLGGTAGLGGAAGLRRRAQPAAPARAWRWAGGLLIVWGLGWSALAITVIIPHFSPVHQYQYWHDGGVIAPGGRPFSLAALLAQLGNAGAQKLHTTLMILLPTAFLVLGSPLALAGLPSLALRFVSTNSYYWGTGWHYNATIMPIVFLAAVDTMARLRARAAPGGGPVGEAAPARLAAAATVARSRLAARTPRYGAALMLAITGWLAVRQPVAGLWHPQTYQISPHVRAERAAMAVVPPGVTVEAPLSMLAPLAARDDTSWAGTMGIADPLYLVFDTTSSGWSSLPPGSPLTFLEQRHPGTVYQEVFESDGVYVFARAWPPG
jgi:uncharacterized membrane protein